MNLWLNSLIFYIQTFLINASTTTFTYKVVDVTTCATLQTHIGKTQFQLHTFLHAAYKSNIIFRHHASGLD